MLDGLGERARRTSVLGERGERWIRMNVGEQLRRGADGVGDGDELLGIECTAESRAPQRVADVARAADTR